MDQDTLSELTVSELKLLCSNRDLDTKGRIAKQTLINKLLSYDKKNNYKKLKFEKNLREWKKDELVLELRARGTKSGNRNKQHIAYKLMHNGQSPNKKKTKSVLIQSNQNKNKNKNKNPKQKINEKSKPRKKSKLKQKEEKMMKAYKALESVNLNIFGDLQNGFKPVNLETKLPHKYNDFDDKVEIPEDLGDELDSFGEKVLELLPLILEIHSISKDFIKYKTKIQKKQQSTDKNIYYVGMKKYKKKKHYNQDEIGPICGVFENLKEFDQFKDDKSVKKQFGKKIARIRYVTKKPNKSNNNSNNSENDDDDIEMASETEQKISDHDDDISDVSDDESLSDDGMVPTDEDEEDTHIINNDNDHDDVAEIVITTENAEEADDTDSDDTDDEDPDDDIDDMDHIEINNDSNKNKNQTRNRNKSREVSKKPAMTKNTRSRREANKNKKVSGRKRRRADNKNEGDDQLPENPKKRLKVNPISG